MPIVKEFSAVSGRATNRGSSAACADSSGQPPGNSRAARVANDFKRPFHVKSEARIPKSETNPTQEARKLRFQSAALCHFLQRAAGADFGHRLSAFLSPRCRAVALAALRASRSGAGRASGIRSSEVTVKVFQTVRCSSATEWARVVL